MQSRRWSLIEAFTNVAVGFGISLASQLLIFYAYDIHLSLGTNALITAYFTVISIIRSYALRRVFNKIRRQGEEQ